MSRFVSVVVVKRAVTASQSRHSLERPALRFSMLKLTLNFGTYAIFGVISCIAMIYYYSMGTQGYCARMDSDLVIPIIIYFLMLRIIADPLISLATDKPVCSSDKLRLFFSSEKASYQSLRRWYFVQAVAKRHQQRNLLHLC